MLAAINSWIESRHGRTWLLAAAAALYLLAYLGHTALPGNGAAQPLGWNGWWDQSQYTKCAAELAHGRLSRETYWYPLGYPLLGALFHRWTPQHAFLLPNLLCVVGIAAVFYQIARKVISPLEAILLMLALLFSYREVAVNSLVIPWNTIPTHLLSYAIILLVGFGQKNRRQIVVSVFCVGLMYLCRPADAFCLALLPALAILQLPNWKEIVRIGSISLAILLLFHGSVLLVKHAVFGAWRTPYEGVVAEIGFASFPILPKVFLLFVDSTPVFSEVNSALLPRFPWLLLIVPGAICFARRLGPWTLGFLGSIIVTYGIYCAFNDFWPGNIFRFHLIHYFVWTLPLLALLSYLAVKEAWTFRSGRWGLGVSLAGLLTWAFVNLTASPYPPMDVSSTIEIPGTAERPVDWISLTETKTVPRLEQAGHALNLHSDYIITKETDGIEILLGSKARQKSTVLSFEESSPIASVAFGRLRWGLAFPRKITALFRDEPGVRLLGTTTGVDLAGPAGEPDGTADQVIEIEATSEVLQQIARWEIDAPESSAHWTSTSNSQGWWLIKVAPVPQNKSGRYQTVRLCFPDFGQLKNAPNAILRAQDASGRVLLSTRVAEE